MYIYIERENKQCVTTAKFRKGRSVHVELQTSVFGGSGVKLRLYMSDGIS